MAINRGPFNTLVDDDGSNLVGSVWNKAAIQTTLLDPIDALVGAVTAWGPGDGSGAGLVLINGGCFYARNGNTVVLGGNIVYPSTADGAAAKIAGLPFPATGIPGGFYGVLGLPCLYYVDAGGTTIRLMNPTTSAPRTNAELSGAQIIFSGVYLVA
jgi:hypothetical protein